MRTLCYILYNLRRVRRDIISCYIFCVYPVGLVGRIILTASAMAHDE